MTQPPKAGSSSVHRAGCCWLSAEEGTLSALLGSPPPPSSPSSPEDSKGKQTVELSFAACSISFLNKQPTSSCYSSHCTQLSVFWAFPRGGNEKQSLRHHACMYAFSTCSSSTYYVSGWLLRAGIQRNVAVSAHTVQGSGGGECIQQTLGSNGKSTVAELERALRTLRNE